MGNLHELLRILDECGMKLSDNDIKIINSSVHSLSMQLPSNRLLIDDRSKEVLYVKSELEYIYYRLKDHYRVLYGSHDDIYNKKFVALTKLGRPSKSSIEAEIYSSSNELSVLKLKLDKLNISIEYIQFLINSLNTLLNLLSSRSYNLRG